MTHRISADTLCAVTWTIPAKDGLRGDLHRRPGYNNFFKGERVLRLHSAGTHISTYETTRGIHSRSRTFTGLFYRPDCNSFKGDWDACANFDIDILEPLGMEVIVSSIRRVRARIGMPWSTWSQELKKYAPPSRIPSSIAPLISPHSRSPPSLLYARQSPFSPGRRSSSVSRYGMLMSCRSILIHDVFSPPVPLVNYHSISSL